MTSGLLFIAEMLCKLPEATILRSYLFINQSIDQRKEGDFSESNLFHKRNIISVTQKDKLMELAQNHKGLYFSTLLNY